MGQAHLVDTAENQMRIIAVFRLNRNNSVGSALYRVKTRLQQNRKSKNRLKYL
jgi:hypothetical protein